MCIYYIFAHILCTIMSASTTANNNELWPRQKGDNNDEKKLRKWNGAVSGESWKRVSVNKYNRHHRFFYPFFFLLCCDVLYQPLLLLTHHSRSRCVTHKRNYILWQKKIIKHRPPARSSMCKLFPHINCINARVRQILYRRHKCYSYILHSQSHIPPSLPHIATKKGQNPLLYQFFR